MRMCEFLLALPIDINEVSSIFPELIQDNTTVEWDEKRGTLLCVATAPN